MTEQRKKFITLSPVLLVSPETNRMMTVAPSTSGANVIKLFTAVSDDFS